MSNPINKNNFKNLKQTLKVPERDLNKKTTVSKSKLVKIHNEKETDLIRKYENTKNDKVLKIHHLNCRSSVNKEEEIFNYIEEYEPDLLFLTETWFDKSVVLTSHIPPGYKMIRNDRSETFKEKYGKKLGWGNSSLIQKTAKC